MYNKVIILPYVISAKACLPDRQAGIQTSSPRNLSQQALSRERGTIRNLVPVFTGNPGFPRIKCGAGSVKHGMTVEDHYKTIKGGIIALWL